jgi:hypothetical protein
MKCYLGSQKEKTQKNKKKQTKEIQIVGASYEHCRGTESTGSIRLSQA